MKHLNFKIHNIGIIKLENVHFLDVISILHLFYLNESKNFRDAQLKVNRGLQDPQNQNKLYYRKFNY